MDCKIDALLDIRRATRADAASIGAICVASVRYAYKGICTDSHLAALSPLEMGRLWLKEGHGHLAVNDPDIAVFIAVDADRNIGFADIGPASSIENGNVAELFAIYVDPEYISHGWGKALFEACATHAHERGFSSLQSKVFSQNRLARSFYEKQGGKSIPESETEIEAGGARAKVITYWWAELPV